MNQWYFDGLNLDQIANDLRGGRWAITDLSSAQDMPMKKGDNPQVPFREGRAFVRKLYDQRVISLGLVVAGPTEIDFDARMDLLKLTFGQQSEKILKRQMADNSYRQALAEPFGQNKSGAFRFRHFLQDMAGKMIVDFRLSEPVFRALVATAPAATTIDASPKTFTITNPGTAQDRSMIITLAGPLTNPRIDNTENSTWVSWTGVIANGRSLVLDVGEFTAVYDGNNALDDLLHSGDHYFLVLEPGANPISVTSDVTTTGAVGFSLNAPFF